ncbi:hypothetical protein [Mycobacterium marinum]|uniref:hypothetical protein n=1 Tax=Mycobacterium marinum TaxID=1781 RepID=UPI0020CF07BF|nr:hypothetical protein [Mycobacterium marinum]
MGDLFTADFWRDVLERVVSSAGQGFINGLGGGAAIDLIGTTDISALPLWAALFSAAGMSVLTFAKCLAAARVGSPADASFRREVPK